MPPRWFWCGWRPAPRPLSCWSFLPFFLLIIACLWRRRPASQTPEILSLLLPTSSPVQFAAHSSSHGLVSLLAAKFRSLCSLCSLILPSCRPFQYLTSRCRCDSVNSSPFKTSPYHDTSPSRATIASQQPSFYAASPINTTCESPKITVNFAPPSPIDASILFSQPIGRRLVKRPACYQPPQLLTDLSTSNLWPSRRGFIRRPTTLLL